MMRCGCGLLLLALVGCGGGEPPRETAKPLHKTPIVATPTVLGAKPAASEPEAANLVNAVVLAHTQGQPSHLDRLKKVRISRLGECQQGQATSKATMEVWIWGDQYRATYAIEAFENRPHTFSLRGVTSGWQHSPVLGLDKPSPLDPNTLEHVLPDVRADRLSVITPLADPALVAALVQPNATEGETVLRLWLPGDQPPVLLHIDAKTKLLQRLTYDSKEQGQTVTRTLSFSKLSSVAGVLIPHGIEFGMGAVVQTRWTKLDYEVPGQFELQIFDQP